MNSLISVIIPVYNVEPYLEQCIQSVRNQTHSRLEIILVEDESTDRSFFMCDEFAQLDSRIRVIHQKNQGLSGARNTGLQEATGDYITFLDSDDYIHPQACAELLKNIQQGDGDISLTSFQEVVDNQLIEYEPLNDGKKVVSGQEAAMLFYETYESHRVSVVAWNKLYRREFIKDRRFPVGRVHEDEFTSYQWLFEAKKVVYSDAVTHFYRQRPGSIMSQRFSLRRLDALDAFEGAILYFQEKEDSALLGKAIKRYLDGIMTYHEKVFRELCEPNVLLELSERFNIGFEKYGKKLRVSKKRLLLYYAFRYNKIIYRKLVRARNGG